MTVNTHEIINYCKSLTIASHEIVGKSQLHTVHINLCMKAGKVKRDIHQDQGENRFSPSLMKATPGTEDQISSHSWPSACNTVKYVMYSKSQAH